MSGRGGQVGTKCRIGIGFGDGRGCRGSEGGAREYSRKKADALLAL